MDYNSTPLNHHKRHYGISVPCLALCVLFVVVLGFLPLTPDSIVQLLKPAFIVICFLFNRNGNYRLSFEKWLIILMIYLTFIWAFNRITRGSTYGYTSMLLFAVFFVVAAMRRWNPREIRTILHVVAFSCTVYAIVVIYSNRGLIHSDGNQHISFLSETLNRNTCAFSSVPGALCAAILFFYSKHKTGARLCYAAAFLICFYAVIALSCRSAFLSVSTGVFLVAWQAAGNSNNKHVNRIALLVFSVIFLLVTMHLLSGTNSSRLFDFSDTGRESQWETAERLIRAKPVFGGGFSYWSSSGQSMSTHNTFLTVMVASGFVGGAILFVMMASMIIECCRARSIVSLGFAMEMIFHSISESGLDYYAYIPMLLATILLRYCENPHHSVETLFSSRSYAPRRRSHVGDA